MPDDTLRWAVHMAEPIEIPFRLCTWWAEGSLCWRHLANTIEPTVCVGDAALCQITLTTCFSLLLNSFMLFWPWLFVGTEKAFTFYMNFNCYKRKHSTLPSFCLFLSTDSYVGLSLSLKLMKAPIKVDQGEITFVYLHALFDAEV